jgi:hypothetical protein
MGFNLGQIIFGGQVGTDDCTKRGQWALLYDGGEVQAWVNKEFSTIKAALAQPRVPHARVQLRLFESLVVLKRQLADRQLVRKAVLEHLTQQRALMEAMFRELHAVSGAGDCGLRRAFATLVLDRYGRLRRADSGLPLYSRVPAEARIRDAEQTLVRVELAPSLFAFVGNGAGEQITLSPRPTMKVSQSDASSPPSSLRCVVARKVGAQLVVESALPGSLPWPEAPERAVCQAAGLDAMWPKVGGGRELQVGVLRT